MSYYKLNELSEEHVRQLHDFYTREWWTTGRALEDVRTMLSGSSYVYAFCAEGTRRLVGFARVLTDDVFKAFIFDLIVDSAHRGHELGQKIMKTILDDPRLARVKHFELYCLPELEPYYERLGFSGDVGGVRLMRYEA